MESFTRVNQSVYFRIPPKTTQNGSVDSKNPVPPPTTVLFFAWMAALPRHYAKFLTYYTHTYPDAHIVLVLSTAPDIFYRSYAAQKRDLEPVVKFLIADVDGRTLVHAVSNGGTNAFSNLLLAYKQSTGQVLPVQAIVLDSAPGRAAIRSGINAMSSSLPMHPILKFLVLLPVFTLLVIMQVIHAVFPFENIIDRARRVLNDPQTTRLEAKRCYIYSKMDQAVYWKDVEDHTHDAESQGSQVIRVPFSGSGHVAHLRMDSDKYWSAIQSLWKSANSDI